MGNCFRCLKTDDTAQSNTTALNNPHLTVSEKINHDNRYEREELLQTTTNLYTNKSSHYDKKSFVINNGSANGNIIDDKPTIQSAKESQLADNAINKLFEEYKDKDEDAILSEGIEKLCQDLNYSPDEFPILVLAFSLDCKQMCKFTKQEFIHGLKKLNATTISDLRLRLIQIVEKLQTDVDLFKQLYRFTFHFGLEGEGARILNLDMAMSLWKLVFTVHKPPDNLLDRWLSFLAKESIRGIQRDTWLMFQNFAECFDLSAYDSNEAWPSLFDDFVEYEISRLKKLESEDQQSNNNESGETESNNNNYVKFTQNEQEQSELHVN